MSSASPTDSLPSKDASLFKSTLKFYEHKQYKRGLKVCEQLLKKHPGHGETLAMKGLFLANMNRKEEGYEHVRLALKTCLKSHVCWHVYGLLYRADKNYEEAMKCYRNALRFDKDNFQILRDLAVLQLQMRHYTSLCETRYQLLGLRTVVKLNWINLVIAYHLSGKCVLAVGVLDAVLDGFPAEVGSGTYELEQSELFLYKAMILEEMGKYDDALGCFTNKLGKNIDLITSYQRRAEILAKLGRLDESKELWGRLFDLNPDCRQALIGLVGEDSSDRACLYDQLISLYQKYPKSLLLKEEVLINSPVDQLAENLKKIILPLVKKGALGSLNLIKRLYQEETRLKVLVDFVEGTLASETSQEKSTQWLHLAIARHYSLCGRHEEAVKCMESLLNHRRSTAPEVFLCYAQILKRCGDLEKAALCMNKARLIDPSDRFLNSKAVKYFLRTGSIKEAQELAVIFVKKGEFDAQLQDLIDMQVLWYALEMGHALQKKDDHLKALELFKQIVKHFKDFHDDQFDFHNYVLRRFTFTSYIKLLRFEDVLPGHRVYKKAVLAAARSALHLLGESKKGLSLEDQFARTTLENSPLHEVSLWIDELLKYRQEDSDVHLVAIEVSMAQGFYLKALRSAYQCHLSTRGRLPPSLLQSMHENAKNKKLDTLDQEIYSAILHKLPHVNKITAETSNESLYRVKQPKILETPILLDLLAK